MHNAICNPLVFADLEQTSVRRKAFYHTIFFTQTENLMKSANYPKTNGRAEPYSENHRDETLTLYRQD